MTAARGAAAGAGAAVRRLDARALRAWPLPPLQEDGDKESRGRLFIVAGSREIPGAALLAAEAALRAGAGKVQVATVEPVALALALQLPEARVIGLPQTPAGGIDPDALALIAEDAARADALLIGPGLADAPAACRLALALRRRCGQVPTLLDAAALGAADTPLPEAQPALITPHAGEMAQLARVERAQVLADPLAAALEAARRWHTIVVLKGSRTLIADGLAPPWQHDGGSIGLGTAGSGDVLAGLAAGLAARGAPLLQAAAWAVVLHGLAGRQLARRHGRVGFLARELAAQVPALLERLPRTRR